jgi:YD repeat-containing protein
MDIYDKDGRLIGYVDPAHIRGHPLEETRQAGERKREEWLRDLARRSAKENWDTKRAREVVEAEVTASRHLLTGAATAVTEGCRACHPAVRSDFDRLRRLRNEAWELDRKFLRRAKHGPYQLLVDILRRQQSTNERHHVATVEAYLPFMRKEYAHKL